MYQEIDSARELSADNPAVAEKTARDNLLKSARALDPLQLTSLDVRRLTRQLRKLPGTRDVRIAYAGNVTLDPLSEFAEAVFACGGLIAASYVAPFGQALQEILDTRSGLRRFQPDFLLLHFDAEALMGSLPSQNIAAPADARMAELEQTLQRVEPVIRAALEHTTATVLVTNFVAPDSYALGIADMRAEVSEEEFFARLNAMLARAFRTEPRVQIVNLSRLTALFGRGRVRDRRLYYVAKLPWQDGFLPALADEIARHVNAALGRVRKCLVVDLDNTLWGGVLGEDGPAGVLVGSGDAIAEAHLDLQRRILALKQRGVLLAVCSKNNPADVDELFRLRDDMPLRREDFVCLEVGWDLKHEGLRRIAEKLNIGTDALVFLDDNPAEIDLIRQMLPEVQCVLVPSDPALRPGCLDRLHSLDRAVITAEDQAKTRQYQENSVRDSARDSFATVEDYLRSLQMRIAIRPASDDLMARAHQLFTKTNQFNVTTQRYSLPELQQLASDPQSRLILIRVEDRFGDLGWVGAVLLRPVDPSEMHIDSFILSCRAMGRGIETAVLNHVKQLCFADPACLTLTARYLPTPKNVPVRDLFELHGFTTTVTEPSGSKSYRLERHDLKVDPCDWISGDL